MAPFSANWFGLPKNGRFCDCFSPVPLACPLKTAQSRKCNVSRNQHCSLMSVGQSIDVKYCIRICQSNTLMFIWFHDVSPGTNIEDKTGYKHFKHVSCTNFDSAMETFIESIVASALATCERLLVLTGAGVSQESGIPAFPLESRRVTWPLESCIRKGRWNVGSGTNASGKRVETPNPTLGIMPWLT